MSQVEWYEDTAKFWSTIPLNKPLNIIYRSIQLINYSFQFLFLSIEILEKYFVSECKIKNKCSQS